MRRCGDLILGRTETPGRAPEPRNLAAGTRPGSSPPSRWAKRRLGKALVLAGGVLSAAPLAGQACPGGTISSVFVDNHSIFDPEEMASRTRLRWAYGLANSLHVRTRESFIRQELLFAEGDCYDPLVLAESERLLRNYRFIARVDVFALRQPDGSWHVVVDTQDEWTTVVGMQGNARGGPHLERVGVTERNLLGRGILVGGWVRRRDGESGIAGRIDLPRIGPSRLDAALSWARIGEGGHFLQRLSYPFLGEVGRLAADQSFLRRETWFPYSVGAGPGAPEGSVVRLYLPFEEERVDVTLAGRIGPPGNLTILGVGFSNQTLEFPGFPGGVEAAIAGRRPWDDADWATADRLRPQTLHSAGTRVNLMVAQRNLSFTEMRGLDALRGTRDVPLGVQLSLVLGRAVAALSGGDPPDDLYASLRAYGAEALGPLLIVAGGGVQGRQIYSGGDPGKGWKDVLAETSALLYWQPPAQPRHTFFLRAAGVGGWGVTLPFQLTLGGPAGVRGYSRDDFPGGRRLVLNVEDRIYLGWPFPALFDLGVTLLADVGRVWAGDAPFGADQGWRGTVGAGLRLGFPANSRQVARLDLAWPVSDAGVRRPPLLRFSIGDPVGLAAGLADRQLARTRLEVGPDRFTGRLP